MLDFITNKCSVERQTKNGYSKVYETISTGIDIDIQPMSGETLGADMVKDTFVGFVESDNVDLFKYNDIIKDDDGIEYVVSDKKFYKGDNFMQIPSHFELTLILNKTRGVE